MMSPVVSIGSAILAGLWASIFDASVFGCLVVVAIRLAKPAAATRHLLYWLVLVVAIAAPVASIAASLGRVQAIAVPMTMPGFSNGLRHADPAEKTQNVVAARSDGASDAPELDGTIPCSLLVGSALSIWLCVAFYKTIGLCIELFALRGVKRRAKALDREIVDALCVWNANAQTLRPATIAISSDVDVPCAAGLWAPSILLPESVVEKQRADDLDRIVMHEAAHLARYDDWTNVFERILDALLWFNPVLALARGRITVDREIACDDWVVARMGGAHGYATCLFRLVEATRNAAPTAHALGALGNARHITERIEHLLSNPKREPRRVPRILCATLGIAALTLTIVQAAQAPAIAIDAATTAITVAPGTPTQTQAAPTAPIAPRLRPLATPIPPIPPIPPDASLSAVLQRLKNLDFESVRRASAEAARDQADAMHQVAEELRRAKLERADGQRERAEAMREAMRAKDEALRAGAEAIGESHLDRAELQRALQEMRDELKREGLTANQ